LQSVPSPKVEELRLWLAEVGELRLKQEEIDRVEEKLEEARQSYRKQGRNERWIEDRILNLVGRNEITDQWRKRGAIEHLHFAKLTAIVHQGALGVTPDEHKQVKGLKRENPRDHMDRVELALLTLAEATTTTKHIETDTQGVKGLEKDAREKAKGSEQVRKITEQSLGRPVVNPQNFLDQPKKVVLTQKNVEGKLEEVDPTPEGKRPCKRHSERLRKSLRWKQYNSCNRARNR